MREKKFLLKDGKEVKFGDVIFVEKKAKNRVYHLTATLCESTLNTFKELGVIREVTLKDEKPPVDKSTDEKVNKEAEERAKFKQAVDEENEIYEHLDYVLQYVSRKLGVDRVEAIRFMKSVEEINPSAAINIILKSISIKLNKKYKKQPLERWVYTVDMLSGKIFTLDTNGKDLKSLRAISYFRDRKDAEFAVKCVRSLLDKALGNDSESK